MKRYLAELQKKPEHHRKQFALLASGTITLFIFGLWSLTTFGIHTSVITKSESVPAVSARGEAEVSPFQSLRMNLAASLGALKSNVGEFISGFETVDFEAEYQRMKDGALDIYGR